MKAILFLILVTFAFSKVVFVSEISRHGARASGSIYNFTVDPTENFKVPMELSTFGMRQHYLIGSQVRKRYIEEEKLISPRLNQSEIIFRTTDTSRTYESGLSQIAGLFPPKECQQTLSDWQQKNAVPPINIESIEDIRKSLRDKALPNCFNLAPIYSSIYIHTYDLVPQDTDCQAYIDVSEPMCKSEERRKLEEPFIKAMKPRFELFLNKTISEGEVGGFCGYLQFADYHNFTMIFNYTAEDINNCVELDNAGLYGKSYGDERLWKIGAKSYI